MTFPLFQSVHIYLSIYQFSLVSLFNDQSPFVGYLMLKPSLYRNIRLVGWLVVWVLQHIHFFRLFNAKSIFMRILLFQTIQFSISTPFKYKYSLIVKTISISGD